MKRVLFAAVVACMALLTSCGVSRVNHTGDLTGSIYGVWALESKNQVDYSGVHFYLSLSEPRIALAKKGSFTMLDLKDVDVDGAQFSYNASKKQLGFTKTLWLTQGLRYEMRLSGTYDVVSLTRTKLVIQKKTAAGITTYSFRRYRQAARRVAPASGHSDDKAMKPYFDIVDSIKANSMTKFDGLL